MIIPKLSHDGHNLLSDDPLLPVNDYTEIIIRAIIGMPIALL